MNYLLKYLVPTLLGDYIEGVDYDNIKTSYFSGLISLQNISLKRDIFTKKGIPLDINYSVIGNLELQIPWLKVRKDPILVTVNDLFLVITLSNPQKIDAVRQRIFFMNEISRACYEKTKSIDGQDENKGNFSGMRVNILDNVQVSLKNIHVRFEDPDRNTILGFVLDEFSVFTTNENWEREFLDRTIEANKLKNLCKKATISNLISYCIIEKDKSKFLVNPDFTDDYRKNYLKVQMEGNLKQDLTKTKESEESSHLIFKMTAELKVIAKNKNLDSIEEPKIYIFLHVKQQGMTLHHRQVENLLQSAERATNIGKLIEHHPPELKEDEKLTKHKEFEALIKKYIESRKGEDADWISLYDEDKTDLGHNFRKYLIIVNDEMIISSVNEAIFEAEKKNMVLSKKKQGGIRGFFAKKPTEITEEESTKADEFMEQLIQKNEEELKKMSEGFLFRICVQVENGTLFLINEEQKKMNAGVSFEMDGFECKLESWKLAETECFQVTMKIDQIMVFLKSKSAGTNYYKHFNIVEKLDRKNVQKKEVVDVVVRREVDKSTERLTIKGEVQELVVNYLTSFFHQLVKFTRFESRLDNLEQMASQEIGSLKTGAGKNFKDFIDKVKRLEISIDFMVASPKFVIPLVQNGDLETDIWLMNVGNIHITTPQKTKFDETMYRIVGLSVTGLSLQYFTKWSNWIEKKDQADHQDVVEDTNASLLVCYMHSALKADRKTASVIVNCELELIALNASKMLMIKLLQLPYCLDFTKESDFHELLVTQKAQIMRSQPLLFKLLYGEERDSSCVGLFYEYYLYLYKNPTDLIPMRITRLVEQNIDLKQVDDYYTIELTDPTKEEQIWLSFTEKGSYEKFTTLMYERIGLGKEILGQLKPPLKNLIQQLDLLSPGKEGKMKLHEDDLNNQKAVTEDKTYVEFQTKIAKLTLSLQSNQSRFLFSVDKMELTNTNRSLQKDLSFNINSFQVTAKKNGVVHNLISSERFQDSKFPYKEALNLQLFSWNSTTFTREHPRFLAKSCKGNAEAVFNSLYVFWKPLLISEMIFTIIDALDEKRVEDTKMNRTEVKIKADNEIIKQKQIKDLTHTLQSGKPLEFDTLNIRIMGLFVSLFTPKTEIEMASGSLNNLELTITSDFEKSHYKGRLENLTIADLTNYPYTISDNKGAGVVNELFGIDKTAKSILEFDVIRYVPYHPKLLDQKRMLFKVDLHSVVINYIQQPVLRLIDYVLNYFLNLDVMKLVGYDSRTLQEIRDEITDATFNDIKITIEKTKVIARAHPTVPHWFELELDLVEIVNGIVPHRNRLKDSVKSIKFTHNEVYKMLFRRATLSKVIGTKEKITFTNQFDLSLEYERCLFIKEYCMLVNDELKTNDLFPVDDSYKLTGNTKALELKLKRDEYVELIDTVFHNILNDDSKDYLYCFRPHLLKEELPIIRWTAKDERAVPISLDFIFESIMLTLWDETRELPLVRLQAINKKMSFLRTQERKTFFDFKFYELQANKYNLVSKNEVAEVSILSVTASGEKQTAPMLSNRKFLIRPGLNLEYMPFEDEREAALGKEDEERIVGKEAPYLENFKINVAMYNQQKKITVEMKDLKVMTYLEDMLRIFDFIKYVPEPLIEEDQDAKIKMGEVVEYREPSSLVFTVMANDSYFCIPSGTEYAIILKSDVVFSYSNKDVQQMIVNSMIETKLDELFSYKLTLQQTEMIVASEKDFVSSLPLAQLTKRILIHPFNLSFSLRTNLFRDQAVNKIALLRKDNVFVDQLSIRIASRDLILLLESNFYLSDHLESYKKLVPFSSIEPEYKLKLNQRKKQQDDYFAKWQIEQMGHDVYMIAHGIQIRLINETQKYSLPLMDLTVIGDLSEPFLIFNSMKGLGEIKSNISLASNYFNPNNSCWEPFIEKFVISFEILRSIHQSPNMSLSVAVKKPLNINISNELIDSALSTIFEWKQKYEISRANKSALSKGKKARATTMYLFEANDQNLNKTENVSPYSVQNMVGYPITILPSEKSMKLELLDDETKDIRFEKSVEELFSTQEAQNPFSHHKVSVIINHPEASIPRSETIFIDELAVKDVFFPVNKGLKPQVFCQIHDIGKKRYITFTSAVQILNEFDTAFDVKFFRKDGKKLVSRVLAPGKTTSVPFDMVSECLSIKPSNSESKSTAGYAISDVLREQQVEIVLPTMFCKLTASSSGKYAVIRIAPILKIKNCLPVKLTFEVTNKEAGETRKQTGTLLCQESAQINSLSLQDAFYLRVGLAGYSASTKVLLSSRKEIMLVNKISLKGSTGSVDLRIYRPPDENYEIIIYARSCIVNETSIPLFYFLKDYKPFPGSSEGNAKGTLVFDKIKEVRIQPMMEDSDFTEEIPIEGLGDRSVDMKMGKSSIRRFNLGLNVSSQLCERSYNLMTKVVSVAPRYLVLNETPYSLVVIQDRAENLENIVETNERLIMHFQEPLLRKFLRFKIKTGEDGIKWCWTGAIDCTGPGEYLLMVLDAQYQRLKYFKISITLESPSYYIQIFEQTADKSGMRIVNDVDCLDLFVAQVGIAEKNVTVPRKTWIAFGWFEPCDCKTIVVLRLVDGIAGNAIAFDTFTFTKIGEKIPILTNYKHKDKQLDIFMEINLEGSSKVMRLYTQKSKSLAKTWDFTASLTIHTIGCSVIYSRGKERVELVYMALHPVVMALKSDKRKLESQIKIKVIEIDNNANYNTLYPCVLYPMKFAKEKKDLYVLDILTSLYLPSEENQTLYFEKVKILVNDLAIQIEGKLLEMFFRFGKRISDQLQKMTSKYNGFTETLFFSPEEKKVLLANNHIETTYKWQLYNPSESAGGLVYIQELSVYQLTLYLSYQHTTLEKSEDDLLETFINTSFVSSIANFEDAPINLSGIRIEGVWDKWGNIMQKLYANYQAQTADFVLGVAFSSRIIGNPVRFWGGIAQGVQDLVEKPIEGFSEGPLEVGAGFLEGVGSVTAKTIGGTFGAVQNITGSLADGISRLAVDKQYEISRDKAKAKKNTNVLTGLTQGVMSFGKSTLSGVTGVVTKPVEGAQKGGFLGFLKGTGQGIAGLVVKPVSGTLDAVSKVTEGVSNTIDSKKDRVKTSRFRAIRPLYGKNKLIKEYSEEDAIGYQVICAQKGDKYTENLVWIDSFLWELGKNNRKGGPISSLQKNEGYYMLVLAISSVFLLDLTQRKIVWKIASNNLEALGETTGGIVIRLKTRDSKLQADQIPIEIRNDDLQIKTLLRLSELMAYIKEKEDFVNMSISKHASYVAEEFKTLI